MVNVSKDIVLVLSAVFLLAGCGADRSKESKKIIEKDNGKLVELTVGNTLIIELPGNPTTGYTWEVGSVNVSVLKQAGNTAKFKADTDLTGSPGKVTLRFKAVGPGKTTLKLIYRRPWEKDIAPIKAYQADVVVK